MSAEAKETTYFLRELISEKCRCGHSKRSRNTFCSQCFYSLTKDQQNALYKKMNEGYQEAHAIAIEVLVRKGRIKP